MQESNIAWTDCTWKTTGRNAYAGGVLMAHQEARPSLQRVEGSGVEAPNPALLGEPRSMTQSELTEYESADRAAWCTDPDVLHRFFAKVERTDSGCWEWTAWTKDDGYGRFALERGNNPYAHRVSYRINVGPIPDHLQINHHCDNRSCVNPEHLYAGTPQENIDDAMERTSFLEDRRGENSADTKLTAEQVREIRERYPDEDCTHRSLAAEYSTSHTTIGKILRNERWTHVEASNDE